MAVLTITPDPATGSHLLSILTAWTVERIQRTDNNGTQDVRTLPGVLPYNSPQAEIARNYAVNPSFETGTAGLTVSSGAGGTSAVTQGPGGKVGSMCGRQTWSVAGTGGSAGLVYTLAATGAAGVTRYGGAWLRSSVSKNVAILFRFRNASTLAGSAQTPYVTLPANEWTWISAGAVTSTGAFTNIQVYALVTNAATNAAGDTLDMDGVYIGDTDRAGFDGDTAPDASGVYSWVGAAHASASILTGATEPLVLDDYEAADGSATYTVTTVDYDDVFTGSAVLDLGVPWLGIPVTPHFSARAETITGYGAEGESRSTVLEPDGSPVALVITRGGTGRRGTLEIYAGTYAAALNLFRLFQRGQVVFLRQEEHPGMDMYFHASRYSIVTLLVRPDGGTVFGVRADYLEVGRPSSPLSGALGWTWSEVNNTYATWGDVLDAYATWGDVQTNRRKTL